LAKLFNENGYKIGLPLGETQGTLGFAKLLTEVFDKLTGIKP